MRVSTAADWMARLERGEPSVETRMRRNKANLHRTAMGPGVATILGGRRNTRVDLRQLRVNRRVKSIDRQRPSLPSFSMSRSVRPHLHRYLLRVTFRRFCCLRFGLGLVQRLIRVVRRRVERIEP